MAIEKLFTPCKIGNVEIKNRFVVPPMGTNYGTYDGMVTDQLIDYYVARAKGGYGLIYTEVCAVQPTGKAILNEIGLWDDSQVPGMKKLADAIHEAGSKIFVQLHHAGRQTANPYIFNMQPVGVSSIPCPALNVPVHELTSDEVWVLVDDFGKAALRAKEAGFDGVEVHGAHGYIVAQFMSQHSNKRVDEWGGDFDSRMKFPKEVFKKIREYCGEDYPISFRFGHDEKVNGGRTLEESLAVARMAEEAGVDVLSISIMTYASLPWMSAAAAMPTGFNEFATEQIKKSVSIPVVCVGRLNNIHVMEDILKAGRADFVALGRQSIADPELPNKVMEGRVGEIAPCIACNQSCLGYLNNAGQVRCLVNPVTGFERKYDFTPVEDKKNVLVVGAGPAGLVAAMNAAKLGHKVTVVEKTAKIGGQFRLAAIPPTKSDIVTAIRHYHTVGKKYGVEYIMNTEVDQAFIEAGKYDHIILATGGNPAIPPIEGIDGANICTAADVLDAKAFPGNNVLIVGGGVTGVETADYLGEHGKRVTVLEMREDIALDEEPGPHYWLAQRLAQWGVQKVVNAKVDKFTADGVVYNGDQVLSGFDTIVLSLGVKSNNPLEEVVKGLGIPYQVIGDALKPGKANNATEAGLDAAFQI
ncbi:MAG: FAD-dependent oxidoreductase [Firmicutes bacterium]|nr:FAD-dependent oxidoreductase [Bacillota bacterium]